MKNHKTLEALELSLANSYALMLKTQNYHWNVAGENFKSLHEMFQTQYEELFSAIDEIAERIRALGSLVDGDFEVFSKKSQIKNLPDKNFSAREMLQDLIADNETIATSLKEAIKNAQAEGDEVSADLFIERAKSHEKTLWMLQASVN